MADSCHLLHLVLTGPSFFYDPLRGVPAFLLEQLSVLGILTINVSVSLIFITEAACPEWSELENAMAAVHSVVHGLVKFSKVSALLFDCFYERVHCYVVDQFLGFYSHFVIVVPCALGIWQGNEKL